MEDAFRNQNGVADAESGYAGGTKSNPTYGDVCSGTTGHAEVVRVTYDPTVVSYEQLLELFYSLHTPTYPTGNIRGGQYRSAIFFTSKEQEDIAKSVKERLEKKLRSPVYTEISPAPTFWRAEEYHQKYYSKHTIRLCR